MHIHWIIDIVSEPGNGSSSPHFSHVKGTDSYSHTRALPDDWQHKTPSSRISTCDLLWGPASHCREGKAGRNTQKSKGCKESIPFSKSAAGPKSVLNVPRTLWEYNQLPIPRQFRCTGSPKMKSFHPFFQICCPNSSLKYFYFQFHCTLIIM